MGGVEDVGGFVGGSGSVGGGVVDGLGVECVQGVGQAGVGVCGVVVEEGLEGAETLGGLVRVWCAHRSPPS